MAKVAFLGLGVMGYPMAGHLLKKGGHEVTVYNRTGAKAQQWTKEYGGKAAPTPREAARDCDFVMMCVGNDDDVRSVVYGDSGALAGMKKGAILVDHTTASAALARELHEKCKAAGVGFVDSNQSLGSTVFAYQGIIGLGWNVDTNFRVNLDGRYYGTSNPQINGTTWTNNNFSIMLGLQLKFGPAAPPPPPPPAAAVAPPSYMVFFDWDRSNLSAQALNTIKQAAAAFKAKGNARITATGHTDTSGPEAYNMALSLRRANTVKDALVREGVPATAIAVIGRGEQGLLVQTADGVREPQNRRVEIVIQ